MQHSFTQNLLQKASQTQTFPLPTTYTFEITSVCNNFCSGCANVELSREKRDRKYNIGYSQKWREIIETIAPQNPLVRLSGGEPTLHPDFPQIVALLEEKGLQHALLTDGRWTVHRLPQILDIYRNAPHFLGMLISLHGSTASTHNAFVESVDSAFSETCHNIQAAAKEFTVFTNCVLTKYSCEEIEETIELSLSLGAKHVVFNRFVTDLPHPLEPTDTQLYSALFLIEKLRMQGVPCRIGNTLPFCFFPVAYKLAHKGGYQLAYISQNGSIRPNNFDTQYWGNVLEQDMVDIWNGEKAINFRTQFSPKCLDCNAISICKGGLKHRDSFEDKLIRRPIEEDIDFTIREEESPLFPALTSD